MIPRDPLQHSLGRLAVSPRIAFRHTLRKRLFRHGQELGYASSVLSPFAWALRFGSTAFGIAVIVSGAYAYENPLVNRTSPLFFIKRLGESVELATARQQDQLVDVYLRIADRRLAESEKMAARGIVDAPTITEVKTNTEQALTAARTLTTSPARTEAKKRVATASRKNAETLRSVSITAQVATKKAVITVQEDLVAIAPPPASLPSYEAIEDGAIEASQPREGAVAGSSLAVSPSVTDMTDPPSIIPDPSIKILDDAISSSSSLAVDADMKEPDGTDLDIVEPAVAVPVDEAIPTETEEP